MLISCYFLGVQRFISVRSDRSDMINEIICLDNAHAGHTKNYCCPINYWPDRKNQDWHLFFKTDFYRLRHRFSQYCVYQCYVCGNFVFYCSEVVVMVSNLKG